MKKAIMIFPAVLLLTGALLLCGCGASAGNDSPTNKAEAVAETTGTESPEPTPIPTPVPTPTPVAELTFPDGSVHKIDETKLDLTKLSHQDVKETA